MVDAQTLTPDIDTINVGAETVNLQPDENFLRAIMVRKLIAAGSDVTQTFDFSGAITATLGDGDVSDPVIVVDGSYPVTEVVPTGWSDPAITCDDDNSFGTGSTATYNVELETMICTFTNSEAVATTTTSAVTTTTVTGTTTTTSPRLPFTGRETIGLGGLAVALFALGLLMVSANHRGRAE
jgi:hypothetical protein